MKIWRFLLLILLLCVGYVGPGAAHAAKGPGRPPSAAPRPNAIPAALQAAASGAALTIVPSPNMPDPGIGGCPGTGQDFLSALAPLASNDVWAVGSSRIVTNPECEAFYRPLTLHWDGTTWTYVPVPPGADLINSYLTAVAAVASNDVWAVGYSQDLHLQESALITHWNGNALSAEPIPNAPPNSRLLGIAAVSANDIWVVGKSDLAQGGSMPLLLHWNGAAWRIVTIPMLPSGRTGSLQAVVAGGANDVWALGERDGSLLRLHWDGAAWRASVDTTASIGTIVAAVRRAASDIWAIGMHGVQHWDGTAWVTVTVSVLNPAITLTGAALTGTSDIWLVGNVDVSPPPGTPKGTNKVSGYTLHDPQLIYGDGHTWAHIPPPPMLDSSFAAVAATSSDLWAVGSYLSPTGSSDTLTERLRLTSYSDIAGNPFQSYIQNLEYRGIIEGYADGTFRPYDNTDRGTLTRWIVRARNWAFDTHGGPHFTDVPTSDPLYPYVETAYNHSVISGYDDHTFRPANPLTRGQMSKMVVNAWGWVQDIRAGQVFHDVNAANPFWSQIETIYAHHLISGYDCGPNCHEFRWGNALTRGQLAKVLANALVP